MKNKTLYQRNHKGQYVVGLSRSKRIGLSAVLLFVLGGFLYQSHAFAQITPSDTSIAPSVSPARDEGRNEDAALPCVKFGAVYDCTDDATKIRIYVLTQKGTKALKWYGKTRISPVTAYTSRVQETDASPCISADGSNICDRYAKGERICASNDYKLGTAIDIQGLGRCIVRDRMNKRYTGTGRVDWYMGMDLPAARAWGVRHVAVSSN